MLSFIKMKRQIFLILLFLLPFPLAAQQILSLEECRRLAVERNKDLEQSRTRLEMAGYDRKIAAANYFPKINAYGTLQYISGDFSLLPDGALPDLSQAGTAAQAAYQAKLQELRQIIMTDPSMIMELMGSKLWQTVIRTMQDVDVSTTLNTIGQGFNAEMDKLTHPEVSPLVAGVVALQQPVFYGGKIIAANKMAKSAEELARMQYEGSYGDILVTVDQAYWQIVSLAAKKRLAENYVELLQRMQHEVDLAVSEGVSTEADALKIRVKANEADMMLSRADNGLSLARMLLCKQIGLPLDSGITLVDENLEAIPLPVDVHDKSLEDIIADRSESRSLELASDIYRQKVNIARADMLPKLVLTANYIEMIPNLSNGLTRDWNGRLTGGVLLSVPVFHGGEALQKTRKARAEATIYQTKYEDACNLIDLQVSQLRKQQTEALACLAMAESNLSSAEENLRAASIGFREGVVDSNTALAAQTAWLQAHSECIDAGIELQVNNSRLLRAEGSYKSDIETVSKHLHR